MTWRLGDERYYGVKGWLGLFCFSLLVLGPLIFLLSVQSYLETLDSVNTTIKIFLIFDLLVSGLLAIFGVYAGYLIWQIKPRAVEIAKAFLILNFVLTIIVGIVNLSIAMPQEYKSEITAEVFADIVRVAIGTAIWYLFLIKSKRVRATFYGEIINETPKITKRNKETGAYKKIYRYICPYCNNSVETNTYPGDFEKCRNCGRSDVVPSSATVIDEEIETVEAKLSFIDDDSVEGNILESKNDLFELNKWKNKKEGKLGTPEINTHLEIFIEFLDEDGWPYERLEEGNVIKTNYAGENGKYLCIGGITEEPAQVYFYSICNQIIPVDKRQKIAEFITRINSGLLINSFELDYDTGEVRLKAGLPLVGVTPAKSTYGTMVYTNVSTMDKYFPGIMRITYGDIEPKRAFDEITGENIK